MTRVEYRRICEVMRKYWFRGEKVKKTLKDVEEHIMMEFREDLEQPDVGGEVTE